MAIFNNLEELNEYLENNELLETTFFTSPSYVDAIIGIDNDNRLIYNYNLMIEHLMKVDNISEEDAEDFICYNTLGTLPNMGAFKPIIMYENIW